MVKRKWNACRIMKKRRTMLNKLNVTRVLDSFMKPEQCTATNPEFLTGFNGREREAK